MKIESLRWLLLPAAAGALSVVLLKGATPGRLAAFALCALSWCMLSLRKVYSLDHDRSGLRDKRPY